MDLEVLSFISFSGNYGRSVQDVNSFVGAKRSLEKQLEDLSSARHIRTEDDRIFASREFQEIFLLENREIELTATSYKVLSIVSSFGSSGALQTDLCNLLKLDNKTLFHHMKPLLQFELVTRLPVASKKSFTYLCVLSKLFIEDTSEDVILDGRNIKQSTVIIKDSIMTVLSKDRNMIFSTKELFEQSCPPGSDCKQFRRSLLALVHDKKVEILSSRELGGKSRIVKIASNDVANEAISHGGGEDDEADKYSAPGLEDLIPLELQIRNFVAHHSENGVTINDVIHNFGLGKKFAFRLMERLVDQKTIQNTDVYREAEFVGRERRYRFRISPNSGLVAFSDSTRDSITRVKRQDAIIQLLQERRILEIGRPLANEISKLMCVSDHTLDLKTLRRSIGRMKAESKLDIHELNMKTAGNRLLSRVIVTLPGTDIASAEFKRLVDGLDHSNMRGHDAYSQSIGHQTTEACADYVDVNKYRAGYIFGFMERLKLVHLIIAEEHFGTNGPALSTLDIFFKKISLENFHHLIGPSQRISRDYSELLMDTGRLRMPLAELPKHIHNQLNSRFRDYRNVLSKLLSELMRAELIRDVGLGIESAVRIPIRLEFLTEVSTKTMTMSNDSYKLANMEDVNLFWNSVFTHVKVPMELDESSEYAHMLDVRNWAAHPITSSVAKRIKDLFEMATETDIDEIVLRISSHVKLQDYIVRVYVEYLERKLRSANGDDDDDDDGGTEELAGAGLDSAREGDRPLALNKRRRTEEIFSEQESLVFRILLVLIENEHVDLQNRPMWSVIAEMLPEKSSEDLRRKHSNMAKSISEMSALGEVRTKILRVKGLVANGLIKGFPEASRDARTLYEWYYEALNSLPSIEDDLTRNNPKCLSQALNRYQWTSLLPDQETKCHLSDITILDEQVHLARKLIVKNFESGLRVTDSFDMQGLVNRDGETLLKVSSLLCDHGFICHPRAGGAAGYTLGRDTKDLLSKIYDEYIAVPSALSDGVPIGPSQDLPVQDIFRLSSLGFLTLTSNNSRPEQCLHYRLVVTRPSIGDDINADKRSIWWKLDGALDKDLFYSALLMVLKSICDSPGTGRRDIKNDALTLDEVDFAVHSLAAHGYVRVLNGRFFPQL